MDKINSLLMAPNLDSPLNNEAANDYKNGSWPKKAQQMTQQYAKWSKYNHQIYLVIYQLKNNTINHNIN